MTLVTPDSSEMRRLSPSAFEAMRSCRLRSAFAQENQGTESPHTPATLLGKACHEALDDLIESGALRTDTWEEAAEAAWQAAIALVIADADRAGPPEDLPGYQIKRVRLRHVARRVRELLLAPDADGAEVLAEATLEGAGGRLFGRPDLIICGNGAHRVIDYKTGQVANKDSGAVKEAYARQLQLYAFLERERSGSWPTSAHLLPFSGQPVEVDVAPEQCEAVAKEAVELLDAFNAAVPGPQPANPSPETCGFCPYPARCPAFWASCGSSWAPDLVATAGTAHDVFTTAGGLVTVRLKPAAGNIDGDEVVLWNISPEDHPDAPLASVGCWIGAISLRKDESRDVFTIPPWGHFSVEVA